MYHVSQEKCRNWVARSAETKSFDLTEVSQGEWDIWVGTIQKGASLSIICNECGEDLGKHKVGCYALICFHLHTHSHFVSPQLVHVESTYADCNFNGKCENQECVCDDDHFGQQCQYETPCDVLVSKLYIVFILCLFRVD